MVQVRVSTPLVLICVMLLPNIKVMLLIDLVMTEQNILTDFLPYDCSLAKLQARPTPSSGVCPSVLLSVTFVHCTKASEHILKLF